MHVLLLIAVLAQSPDDLVRQLGNDEYVKREEASQMLEDMGALAVAAVEEASLSNDPEVRARACEILLRMKQRRDFGGVPDPDRMGELLEAAGAPRIRADGTRNEIQPKADDAPCLLALLSDPGLSCRFEERLLGGGDSVEHIRLGVLHAIARLPASALDEARLSRILESVFPEVPEFPGPNDAFVFTWWVRGVKELQRPLVLGALSSQIRVGFERLLQIEDPAHRGRLVDCLADDWDASAKPLLVRLLGDPDPAVAQHALKALWRYDVSDARAEIQALTRSTHDPELKLIGSVMLARSGDFCGLSAIMQALLGDDVALRARAAEWLLDQFQVPHEDESALREGTAALESWWAENREVVHWDPLTRRWVPPLR